MACGELTTFEQKHKLLHQISWRYVGRIWEHDELVNQMWLYEKVRQARTRQELVRAGFDAMFKYFRHEIKRNKHEKFDDKELFDNVTQIMLDLLKMDMDELCKGMTRTKKLILKLKCDGFTLKEIAKVVGLKSRAGVMSHINTINREPFKEWLKV